MCLPFWTVFILVLFELWNILWPPKFTFSAAKSSSCEWQIWLKLLTLVKVVYMLIMTAIDYSCCMQQLNGEIPIYCKFVLRTKLEFMLLA